MRRSLTLIVFALLVLPFVVSAQDQKIGWNLQDDHYVDVSDLGFRFYYPTGWVLDTSKGIALGQTQEDIDAQNDDDDSTQAAGMVIGIRGIPLAGLTDLGDDPSLDDIVDFAVKGSDVTEDSRAETSVMTRRSITVNGSDKAGRQGFATFWKQGDYVVFVTLGLPEKVTVKEMAYTWDVTLGSVKPLDAQELGDGMLTDDTSHFTINYPADWTPDPKQPVIVYELADDIGQKNFNDVKGSVFTFSDAALSDLQLKDDATLDDVIEKAKLAFDLDDTVTREEFVLLGQPAITISGQPSADSPGASRGVVMTIGLVDGRAILLILAAPSKDAIDSFMPTWIQMLRSVKSTETA
jgi:hypothetical protein